MPRLSFTIATLLLASTLFGCEQPAAEGWSTDRSYPYDARMTTRALVGAEVQPSEFSFEMAAVLQVTPLEVTPARAKLALTFRDAVFSGVDDAKAKERFARVASELGRPAVITYVNGVMNEAELGKNLEAVTVGILRNFAGALQLPDLSSAAAEITNEEYDATGRYVARYTRSKAAGTYGKSKQSYQALIMDTALQSAVFNRKMPPPSIEQSSAQLELAHGRLVSLRSQERLALPLIEASKVSTETTMSLVAKPDRLAVTLDPVALSANTERLAASEPYRTATAHFDFNAIKIGDRGFDELRSKLEALAVRRDELKPTDPRPAAGLDPAREEEIKRWSGEQNQALTAMATLLRTEPELIDRAMAAIRAESPASQVLIASFGAAGIEAAQLKLLALMQDAERSDRDRNAAGMALIRTKAPTVVTARALEGLLDDRHWGQHAALGLGTYARLFKESGRFDEHKRIGDLLLKRLHGSATNTERSNALLALSNSGYARMVGELGPYLDSPDLPIREPAVRALRLVQDPAVEPIVLAKLKDQAPAVRASALEVAERLGPTAALGKLVQECALRDDNANTRLIALQLLIAWRDQVPGAQATIEQVATVDPSESIRKAAQRAVASKG